MMKIVITQSMHDALVAYDRAKGHEIPETEAGVSAYPDVEIMGRAHMLDLATSSFKPIEIKQAEAFRSYRGPLSGEEWIDQDIPGAKARMVFGHAKPFCSVGPGISL